MLLLGFLAGFTILLGLPMGRGHALGVAEREDGPMNGTDDAHGWTDRTRLRVATANVQSSLSAVDAGTAVGQVLDAMPDLVALQEWYPMRWRILRTCGCVHPVPGARWTAPARATDAGYLWAAPFVGGTVIGARRDTFELVKARSLLLSGPGRAEWPAGWRGLQPARFATVALLRRRRASEGPAGSVAFASYHLVSGVQRGGAYRPDRPRLVARHQQEVRRLSALVEELRRRHPEVYVAGDGNFDGLRLPRLASCWDEPGDHLGTLGPRRRVDDIHGPVRPSGVRLIETPSDHRSVVADFPVDDARGGLP